jgi:hypothetical protein
VTRGLQVFVQDAASQRVARPPTRPSADNGGRGPHSRCVTPCLAVLYKAFPCLAEARGLILNYNGLLNLAFPAAPLRSNTDHKRVRIPTILEQYSGTSHIKDETPIQMVQETLMRANGVTTGAR